MKLGIALGSNLGDRLAMLREALSGILSFSTPVPPLISPVYETEPVGCPEGSERFLNAVVEADATLEAPDILTRCREIERLLGRPENRETNAPRVIDIDILYYGTTRISSETLTIPHPRLAVRRFVLEPLSQIRPRLVLPGEEHSVKELLARLESDEDPPVLFRGPDWYEA